MARCEACGLDLSKFGPRHRCLSGPQKPGEPLGRLAPKRPSEAPPVKDVKEDVKDVKDVRPFNTSYSVLPNARLKRVTKMESNMTKQSEVAKPDDNPTPRSWKGQVKVYREREWLDSNIRFATEDEAELYAHDLFNRWSLATEWQAVPSDNPVNYRWDGKLHAFESAEQADTATEKPAA